MAVILSSICSSNATTGPFDSCVDEAVVPLVDEGAPYLASGNVELLLLLDYLDHIGYNDMYEIESILSSLIGHIHWQIGVGGHFSAPRSIPGSIIVSTVSGSGRKVLVRHLVLNGYSQ